MCLLLSACGSVTVSQALTAEGDGSQVGADADGAAAHDERDADGATGQHAEEHDARADQDDVAEVAQPPADAGPETGPARVVCVATSFVSSPASCAVEGYPHCGRCADGVSNGMAVLDCYISATGPDYCVGPTGGGGSACQHCP